MQVGLLGLENGNGCLSLLVLRLLSDVIALHFFLGASDVIGEGLPDVGSLVGQVHLQLLLLPAQDLDLTVVEV